MGDRLWSTRFRPVMGLAIPLLANLLGGRLLDELFAKTLIEEHHYHELLEARESEERKARRLYTILSREPEPSFTDFCAVLRSLSGGAGRDLIRLLTQAGTPSSEEPFRASSHEEVTVFVDVINELEDLYKRHEAAFETALKD